MAGLPRDFLTVPTGRHGLPADIVAAHQRERLLAATIELVAKRGFRGTSIDHIVKTARVGYVAFYELFESKEDCFIACFDRIVAEAREQIAAAVSGEAPWSEQICGGLKKLLELIAAEPARARLALVEMQAAGRRSFAMYEELVYSVIPKLREGRAFRPDAAALSETLEEAVIGGVAWIIHQRLVKGEADEIEGLIGEAIHIALAPYLGESEAQRLALAAT